MFAFYLLKDKVKRKKKEVGIEKQKVKS